MPICMRNKPLLSSISVSVWSGLLILLGAYSQSNALTLTELRDANIGAVVFISVPFRSDSNNLAYTLTGTGVVISEDGVIITCDHLLQPDPGFSRGEPTGSIASRRGTLHTLAVLEQDQEHDIALLRLPDIGNKWQAARYDYRRPNVGANIVAMGFPADCGKKGRCDLVTPPGQITGISPATRLLTNALLYHGHSGGPVFSDEGKVIAIVAGGEQVEEQLNELIPIVFAKAAIEIYAPRAAEATTASNLAASLAGIDQFGAPHTAVSGRGRWLGSSSASNAQLRSFSAALEPQVPGLTLVYEASGWYRPNPGNLDDYRPITQKGQDGGVVLSYNPNRPDDHGFTRLRVWLEGEGAEAYDVFYRVCSGSLAANGPVAKNGEWADANVPAPYGVCGVELWFAARN